MFDKVISALVENGKVEQFFRIKEQWLKDAGELDLYHFVRNYIVEYSEIPNDAVLTTRFHKTFPIPHGRYSYEVGALRDRHIYTELVTQLPLFAKGLKKSPVGTLAEIKKVINDLETVDEGKASPLNKAAALRFARYLEKVGSKGVTYLSMGHKILDDIFYGYGRTDLITIGGRPGLGKTWFLIVLVLLAEQMLADEMGPILFITNEMGVEQIEDRMDSKRFSLDFKKFLQGELPRDQRNRLRKGLEALELEPSKIVIIDGCYSVDELRRLILLYQPALVALDGSYLMDGEGNDDWKRITYLTRGMKRICKTMKVPIINTTQMRGGTGTKKAKSSFDAQDDFSFSKSYAQDSDLALSGFQTPQMVYHNHIGFNVAKGRNVVPGTTLIWEHNLVSMKDDFFLDGDGDDDIKPPDEDVPVNEAGKKMKRISTAESEMDVAIIV